MLPSADNHLSQLPVGPRGASGSLKDIMHVLSEGKGCETEGNSFPMAPETE